jgi:beta-lactamase superfamily II metal-dependent hydrolase
VKSTRRQLERYVDWWGTKEFGASLTGRGLSRRGSWDQPAGLVATATQLIDLLSRRKAGPPPGSAPVPPPVATSAQGGSSGSSGAGLAAPTEASAAAVPRTDPSRGSDRPFFTIEALPAGHGDCLWIEYGDDGSTHRVLIDCGTQATSKALLARVDAMPEGERFLELFVLSHIDSDHIGGALPFFKAVKSGLRFGDVWYNGWRHISGQLGARQGEMFSSAILDFELPWNVWRAGASILTDDDGLPEHVLPGGMRLTLLSPTRERLNKLAPIWTRELKRYGLTPGAHVDYAKFLKGTPSTIADAAALQDIDGLADVKFGGDNGAPNGTSIALLAEFGGASALLAADAHAPVLEAAIGKLLAKRGGDRLKLDLFKVSHHGSQNNVSSDLIRKLDCSRYLISTNGDHFYHPDRQAIARILKYGGDRKELFFNYNSTFNQVWGDAALASVRERYNCSTTYPSPDQQGIVVPLL